MANSFILVTGPSRSGKSEWAEQLALRSQGVVIYLATAQMNPADPEWQTRIQAHQNRRPAHWQTLEVPIDLATAIQTANPSHCLLIDSLGTWVANLVEQDDSTWSRAEQALLQQLALFAGEVIAVAEEVGWGVVPAYPVGRLFRDRLGALVRQLGEIAHSTYLVTGGHVLNLSELGHPLPSAVSKSC